MVVGYWFADPLGPLTELDWLKWSIVFVTMFLMAWPISFEHLKSTLSRPVPALLASLLNVGLIPLIAWPLAPLCGPELGPGLLIAAATPSTLASAAVWTRRALGNDGVAIMVTIITNSTCFLVLPMWIYFQTGDAIDSSTLTGTIYKLLIFVVLPIGVGQMARIRPSWADWATQHKPRLSIAAMIGLLSIVFLGAINMGLRLQSPSDPGSAELANSLGVGYLLATAALVAGIHVAVFWLGYGLGPILGISQEDRIAVGFSGSQKTLMIGLSTAISLGFSMIPIVFYHAIQLLIDTVFAERLRARQLQRADAEPQQE